MYELHYYFAELKSSERCLEKISKSSHKGVTHANVLTAQMATGGAGLGDDLEE